VAIKVGYDISAPEQRPTPGGGTQGGREGPVVPVCSVLLARTRSPPCE
jgi:hypothetical protein